SQRVVRAEANLGAASGAAPPLRRQDDSLDAPSRTGNCQHRTRPSAVAAGRGAGPRLSQPRPRAGIGIRLAARSVPGRDDGREWSPALASRRRVMRILLLVHGCPPLARGGTETYSYSLATRLRDTYG